MAGLRRNISAASVCPPTHDGATIPAVSKMVNCGNYVLVFSSGEWSESPGFAKATLKLCRAKPFGARNPALLDIFRAFLSADFNLVVTFDFRRMALPCDLANAFVNLCDQLRPHLERHLKFAAVLVHGSMFTAATAGQVSSFVQGCVGRCPCIICHTEHVAKQFFRNEVGLGAAGPYTFVSVVDVQEATHALSFRNQSACIASLEPVLVPTEKCSGTPYVCLHKLSNGDVRVIQALPRDILTGISSNDVADHCESKSLPALLFKGPAHRLKTMKGLIFHLGEIMFDAEMESEITGYRTKTGFKGCLSDVFVGLHKLFCVPSVRCKDDGTGGDIRLREFCNSDPIGEQSPVAVASLKPSFCIDVGRR